MTATNLPLIATLTDPTVTEAQFKTALTNLLAALRERGDPLGMMGCIQNLGLAFSVGSGALTCALKQRDGSTNADSTNVITVPFRSATATSGAFIMRNVTAALSLTVSSGSTLGHSNGVAANTFWYLIDNSGTLELAVSSKFFGWSGIVSTTAEGGAGAADSATVMYSATARTSVPYICIAKTVDTQTTAGTWAAVPTNVYLAPFDLLDQASATLDLIGSTRGAILERGANGWQIIPPGTGGYALVSNGVGADPSYQAVGGGSLHQQLYTSTGAFTFTAPAGTQASTVFKFTITGAGGGGGGSNVSNTASQGGSAAGTCLLWISGLTAGSNYSGTIGAKGNGGSASSNGGNGGASSITIGATTYTANGGAGGTHNATSTCTGGQSGGAAANGTINLQGGDSGPCFYISGSTFGIGGDGGGSYWGPGGRGGAATGGGAAASFGAGGGGGGSGASNAGGNGADGAVLVEWAL